MKVPDWNDSKGVIDEKNKLLNFLCCYNKHRGTKNE